MQIVTSSDPLAPIELKLEGKPEEWKAQIELWAKEVTRFVEEMVKGAYQDFSRGTSQLTEADGQPTTNDLLPGQMAYFMNRIYLNANGVIVATDRLAEAKYTILRCRVTRG